MADKIQVFCTRSIQFTHPKDKSVVHKIRNHEFTYAPSWIKDTPIFKALVKENSIKVIESAKDVSKIETSGKIAAKELSKEAYAVPEVEIEEVEEAEEDVFVEGEPVPAELKDLTNKQLYAMCVAKGMEVEPKKNKAYYLEKLEA